MHLQAFLRFVATGHDALALFTRQALYQLSYSGGGARVYPALLPLSVGSSGRFRGRPMVAPGPPGGATATKN